MRLAAEWITEGCNDSTLSRSKTVFKKGFLRLKGLIYVIRLLVNPMTETLSSISDETLKCVTGNESLNWKQPSFYSEHFHLKIA